MRQPGSDLALTLHRSGIPNLCVFRSAECAEGEDGGNQPGREYANGDPTDSAEDRGGAE